MKRYTVEEFKKAVEDNKSIAGVLRQLGLRPIGGNYKTIHRLILKNNLNTYHFTGQGWNVGLQFRPQKEYSNEEIFKENSNYKSSWRLREKFLLLKGERKCDKCNNSVWLDEPIPLEIHHINGINTDHRIENLQLLCPNCHAQTDNYRGKAQLSALSEKRDVEYRKFRESLTGNADGNPEPSLSDEEGAETRHDTSKEVIL